MEKIIMITLAVLILADAWIINPIIMLTKLKSYESKFSELYSRLKNENNRIETEYSEKMLEFAKMLTTQVSILMFKEFIDSHDISKITRINIKELASTVAEYVHASINISNIDFNETLFTKEFYEKYIIDTSFNTIKSLLDRVINDEVGEE